jgi:5-methylcytosine-specific restriction endonuclease McrA
MIEDFTEYHRNYYYQRRQKIWEYLGGECARCGRTDRLEVDHIDRSQKSFNISENMTLSNDRVRAELDKCQLLCEDHHHEKTAAENSGFTHGTIYGWMKRHCDCDECTRAKRAWYDSRNARRRKAA